MKTDSAFFLIVILTMYLFTTSCVNEDNFIGVTTKTKAKNQTLVVIKNNSLLKNNSSYDTITQISNNVNHRFIYEFNNMDTSSSVNKLNNKLQTLDRNIRLEREQLVIDWTNAYLKHPVIIYNDISTAQVSIINSFPIPNSNKEIFEFLSISIKQIGLPDNTLDYSLYGAIERSNDLNQAWLAKSKQVIMKARTIMKNDKSALEEVELYADKLGV
jgi:hypothetical protein